MNDRFRVGIGIKPVTALFEIGAQLLKIINLAVENDRFGPIRIENRLLPAGEIDDREPAHREGDRFLLVKAFLVRPAMNDTAIHPLQNRAIRRAEARINKSDNSTHLF
jgi:hypothetical protein